MNCPDGSVTLWLEQLKAGNHAAAQPLWERYCTRLAELARQQLAGTSLAVVDEEDVALSVFDAFCRGVAGGRFPRLDDRADLWRLLVMLTIRKAATQREREARLKRGGGLTRLEVELDQLPDDGPTPALAAQVEDELRRLLAGLGNAVLARVARLRLEGHSVADIAQQLGTTERTIERKLRVIRTIWSGEETSP